MALWALRNGILVDVRMQPHTRQWGKEELVRTLGSLYVHVPELGNVNYRGGPIQLLDPGVGVARVLSMMDSQEVVLMCACEDYDRCHRKVVVQELVAAAPFLIEPRALFPAQRKAQPELPFR